MFSAFEPSYIADENVVWDFQQQNQFPIKYMLLKINVSVLSVTTFFSTTIAFIGTIDNIKDAYVYVCLI